MFKYSASLSESWMWHIPFSCSTSDTYFDSFSSCSEYSALIKIFVPWLKPQMDPTQRAPVLWARSKKTWHRIQNHFKLQDCVLEQKLAESRPVVLDCWLSGVRLECSKLQKCEMEASLISSIRTWVSVVAISVNTVCILYKKSTHTEKERKIILQMGSSRHLTIHS